MNRTRVEHSYMSVRRELWFSVGYADFTRGLDSLLRRLNVDALSADSDNGEDAIEACFRRFYGCYGNYYGGCYGYNYHCYRPCYSYYYCYRPVYTYCYTPVYYHYWGCY